LFNVLVFKFDTSTEVVFGGCSIQGHGIWFLFVSGIIDPGLAC
jgi:hypothetical protein